MHHYAPYVSPQDEQTQEEHEAHIASATRANDMMNALCARTSRVLARLTVLQNSPYLSLHQRIAATNVFAGANQHRLEGKSVEAWRKMHYLGYECASHKKWLAAAAEYVTAYAEYVDEFEADAQRVLVPLEVIHRRKAAEAASL